MSKGSKHKNKKEEKEVLELPLMTTICQKTHLVVPQKTFKQKTEKEKEALRITKEKLNILLYDQIINLEKKQIETVEGKIPFFVFYNEFLGVEMDEEKFKSKKKNIIEITDEFEQIYLETCHILLDKNIEVNEETLLHYTAGIVKIMSVGKSKEEAKQIVSDLNDKFGIIHFGRHSKEQLLFQHDSVEWINCPDGTRNGKIKFKECYSEIVAFLDSAYEKNGYVYTYNEKTKKCAIQNQIKIINNLGAVLIYEINKVDNINESVKDIEKTFQKDLEENINFSIVMRGHGEVHEIVLEHDKHGKKNLTRKDNVNLSGFDTIYILACSTGHIYSENLARKLSIKFPNSLVIAPNLEIYGIKDTNNIKFKNEIQIEIEKKLHKKISKIPYVYVYNENKKNIYGVVLYLNGEYYRMENENIYNLFRPF